MASEQTNTNEVIPQAAAEATRAAVQAIAVAGAERPQNVGPRLGRPVMKQPNFIWEAEDKYNTFKNFRLVVNNIFKLCSKPQTEQLVIIKSQLDRKGLQFIQSLTQMEQERCNTIQGPFTALNNKFKPKFNETIKSLRFCKLSRQTKENPEQMGRLRLAAVECNYREVDRQLKEQFIHWFNDNDMFKEIIWKLTKAKESTDITCVQLLG